MIKLPQIQAGQFLDFLQAVHQSVAVNKQFSGSFGHIQVVLKELVNSKQGFVIQAVDGILLEHLAEENLT